MTMEIIQSCESKTLGLTDIFNDGYFNREADFEAPFDKYCALAQERDCPYRYAWC